jgi:hypothetical protein
MRQFSFLRMAPGGGFLRDFRELLSSLIACRDRDVPAS